MIAENVYVATEPHRRACEAREILRWPLIERRAYLAAVRKTRGDASADALQEAVVQQWRLARGKDNTNSIGLGSA